MLTFPEFQATKRECPDLGTEFSDASLMGFAGLVYADCCYIERRSYGQYYLVVGRSDWISDDLATLERRLYDEHYVHEADDIAPQPAAPAMPLYRQEFPDFDYDLPVIPGMVDHSWHNDVCPSLVGNGLQLWCDYADPALREMQGGDRFALYRDVDGSMGDLILSSDSLDAIVAAMAAS